MEPKDLLTDETLKHKNGIIYKSFRSFRAESPASSLVGKFSDLNSATPYKITHSTLCFIQKDSQDS